MIGHHSSRIARAKAKDRDRQQALRDRRKKAGTPGTHTINRAIVRAFLLELKAQRPGHDKIAAVQISAGRVLGHALEYLTAGTHGGNSYSKAEVYKALVNRIRRDAPLED